jgi:2,4-dienoyl-CoA reductase-like NADH-dependent reductase (Old Yellow Enzyme family)
LLDGADPAPLFEPVDIAGLRLRNRLVMAPMTREFSPGGVPGHNVAAYYARRASSLGLLITEGTYVDEPSAGSSDRVPRFYGADALAGWRDVAAAVHAEGGAIFPQLWHLGATRQPGSPPNPEAPVISPSGLDGAGRAVGDPASAQTLHEVAASFARAAADAQDNGFDGVEVHGAHGYLLDQFHWPATNRRTDSYGGDIAGRVRLSAEVVAAIRAAVGPHFPIAFRFSQWKGGDFDARIAETPAELEGFLAPLASAGVSLFHVSTRRYWLPAFGDSGRTMASWTRHLTGLPVIGLGSVGVSAPFRGSADEGQRTLALAPLVDLVRGGELDLVGVGRAVLGDPEWARKVEQRRLDEIRLYDKSAHEVLY